MITAVKSLTCLWLQSTPICLCDAPYRSVISGCWSRRSVPESPVESLSIRVGWCVPPRCTSRTCLHATLHGTTHLLLVYRKIGHLRLHLPITSHDTITPPITAQQNAIFSLNQESWDSESPPIGGTVDERPTPTMFDPAPITVISKVKAVRLSYKWLWHIINYHL